MTLTHAKLLEILRYDPESGRLFRRLSRQGKCADWLERAHGRTPPQWRVRIDGRTYQAARVAWFYVTGSWPVEIDHVDRNASNNRWNNLREASHQQNQVNRGPSHHNRCGIKGVWQRGRKYESAIMRNGTRIHLGTFDSKEAAAAAYAARAISMDGEFASVA